MSLTTIQDYVRDPSGNPAVGATVTIDLIAAGTDIGSGFVSSGSYTILDALTVTTDQNGYWSVAVQANSDITPTGTYYRVIYKRFAAAKSMPPFYISVPTVGGPYWVGTIVTNPITVSSGSSATRIGDNTNNTLSLITSTTPVDLQPSGLSVPVSLGVDPIKVKAFVPKAWINDGNTGILAIYDGATLIAASEVNNIYAREVTVYEEITPTPGSHTFTLQGAVVNAGGALRVGPTQSLIRLSVDKV